MSLFYGIKCGLDCGALTGDDLASAALALRDRLPQFGSVEGVPTGGERLATMLADFATSGPLLIVDDVFTTGRSIETYRGERPAIGAVIFARFRPPSWITPLFVMTPELSPPVRWWSE